MTEIASLRRFTEDLQRKVEQLEQRVLELSEGVEILDFSDAGTGGLGDLQNSWAESVYIFAKKDTLGNVELGGKLDASSATSGTIAFYLPDDWAPRAARRFITANNGGSASSLFIRITIDTAGAVYAAWNSGAWTASSVSLDGCRWNVKD